MASSRRQLLTIALLAVGIGICVTQTPDRSLGWQAWIGAAAGLIFAVIGPLNRGIGFAFARINRWVRAHPVISLAVFGLAFAGYLLFEASANHDEIFLRVHDEHSYMIQARILLRGRLWMPAYPPDVAPFFDTLYMIVDRVYASMYCPGTALAEALALLLHLPYWSMPLACGAAAAALFFSIVLELFDGIFAIVATLVLITRPFCRLLSLMLLSEMPVMFAILLFIWAWLRWRRRRNLGWALLIGLSMGWAAITRPADTMCFALPVGIAILFELRRSPRLLLGTVGMMLLGVLPFATLQIVQNIGITGRWTMAPEQYYHLQNFPGPALSFGPYDLSRIPQGLSAARRSFALAQLDGYRHHLFREEIANWYSTRFVELRFVTLPSALLVLLLPLGVSGMRDLPRKVICAGLLLFLITYFVCVFHLYFYMLPAAPAVICVFLMGWEALEKTWPRQRKRIRPFIAMTLIGLAAWQLPEINPRVRAVLPTGEKLKQIREDLSTLSAPSLVLYPFDERRIPMDSFPVFNEDVAWPDDAVVIRVNDLGEPWNRSLYAYYARIQPQRQVFVHAPASDNDPHPLKFLGTAGELAAR
jgi:hypothetical protein